MDSNKDIMNKIKRFFEPFKYAKKDTFAQFFKGVLAWGTPFIHVIFFQKAFSYMENGNQEGFLQYLGMYLVIIICIEIIDALTYNW